MEVRMKKNFILIFSFFIFLPILTYASSENNGAQLDHVGDNDLGEEVQELPIKDIILLPANNSSNIINIIKDIVTSVGHTLAVIGHAIVTFGDDGEETDNAVEKVGKHVGFFGNFLKKIGDFLKKV